MTAEGLHAVGKPVDLAERQGSVRPGADDHTAAGGSEIDGGAMQGFWYTDSGAGDSGLNAEGAVEFVDRSRRHEHERTE